MCHADYIVSSIYMMQKHLYYLQDYRTAAQNEM